MKCVNCHLKTDELINDLCYVCHDHYYLNDDEQKYSESEEYTYAN